jgi:hypothetical protein
MATLQEMMIRATEELGRFDLITADNQDNGIVKVINSAVRKLDSMWVTPSNKRSFEGTVLATHNYVGVEDLRLPSLIYLTDDAGVTKTFYYQLSPSATREEVEWYQEMGDNLNYKGARYRYAVINSDIIAGVYGDFKYNQIWLELLPAPIVDSDIVVQGDFYTPPLVELTDTNYWLASHEQAVVWAVGYILEVSLRNLSGALEWDKAIRDYLKTDFSIAASREWNDNMELQG